MYIRPLRHVRFSIDLMSCDIPESTIISNLREMVNSELLSDVTFMGETLETLGGRWARGAGPGREVVSKLTAHAFHALLCFPRTGCLFYHSLSNIFEVVDWGSGCGESSQLLTCVSPEVVCVRLCFSCAADDPDPERNPLARRDCHHDRNKTDENTTATKTCERQQQKRRRRPRLQPPQQWKEHRSTRTRCCACGARTSARC